MRTEDYEEREEIAIESGKAVLAESPWLFDRRVEKTRGFFAEVHRNDVVHPDYYSVHAVDGIGTKIMYSAWSGDFSKAMIDGIAMSANDFAPLMGAFVDTVTLYFAAQAEVEEEHMGEIMEGTREALEQSQSPHAPFNMNIGKIETASLDEIVGGPIPGLGWDVAVCMTGYVEKSRVPPLKPRPGDAIIGVRSSGLHSNGHTAARHVLLTPDAEYREEWKPQYRGRFHPNDTPEILEGMTILEALQIPTNLHLTEANYLNRSRTIPDFYGVNVTGNGLHNFNRVGNGVSFEITDPFEPHPIHFLLIQESKMSPEDAYRKHNMGMGFAYIVPGEKDIPNETVRTINSLGVNQAKIVGEVAASDSDELRTTIHKPYEGGPLDFVGYAN